MGTENKKGQQAIAEAFIAETWANLRRDTQKALKVYRKTWPMNVVTDPEWLSGEDYDHPVNVIARWDSFDEEYPKPVKPILGTHQDWKLYFGQLRDRSRRRSVMRHKIFIDLVYDEEDGRNYVTTRYHDVFSAGHFETFVWVFQAARCLHHFEQMGRPYINKAVKLFDYFKIWLNGSTHEGVPEAVFEASHAEYAEGTLAWRLFDLFKNGDPYEAEREDHMWKVWHLMQAKKPASYWDGDQDCPQKGDLYRSRVFAALKRDAERFGGKYADHRKWYRPGQG